MFIRRELEKTFLEASRFFSVLLLTGARQVGKTTMLKKIAEPERRFVSLDPLDARVKAMEDPRLFLADNPPPVIIDEIQYAPQLLPYIKEIVDKVRTTDPDNVLILSLFFLIYILFLQILEIYILKDNCLSYLSV